MNMKLLQLQEACSRADAVVDFPMVDVVDFTFVRVSVLLPAIHQLTNFIWCDAKGPYLHTGEITSTFVADWYQKLAERHLAIACTRAKN